MKLELSDNEEKDLLKHVYKHTNAIKPHEAEIISSLLKIHTGEHHWRFQRHIFCEGCHRELTVLDYFLSSLKHHSINFILKEVCPDFEKDGTCDHEADSISVDRVDVVEHGMEISCVNCGVTRPGYELYLHPGCKGYVIRMPERKYNEIKEEMSKK